MEKRNKIIVLLFVFLTSSILVPYSNYGIKDDVLTDFSIPESNNKYHRIMDFLVDKEISGVVEGTAKMIDTENYFAKHKIKHFSAAIDISIENYNDIEISIGYKSNTIGLFRTSASNAKTGSSYNIKEIKIWSGKNLYPKASTNKFSLEMDSDENARNIPMKWDLKKIGFSQTEFVNAESRIWYLKIKPIINGNLISYEQRINYLRSFTLIYDDIAFRSLLHPFFDGSCDLIIPIRGVQHELLIKENLVQTKSVSYGDYWDYKPISENKHWCVVFASGDYPISDDLPGSVEACIFIMGCVYKGDNHGDYVYYGILEYGWNVVYCISNEDNIIPLETCSVTKDEYFIDMMRFVDDDSSGPQLGSNDQLIVFTCGHGKYKKWFYGHSTIVNDDESGYAGINTNEYKSEIRAIAKDGTYVFLWVKACNGYGFDGWSSFYHQNHLNIWYYTPIAASETNDYNYYYYNAQDEILIQQSAKFVGASSMAHFMKNSLNGQHITQMFSDVKSNYDHIAGDTPTYIDQETYWGSYQFKVKKDDLEIDYFSNFNLIENSEIYSFKTQNYIMYTYTLGGSTSYVTEIYQLEFLETTSNFEIEVYVDWEVQDDYTIWNSLLEVGLMEYAVETSQDYYENIYNRIYAIGTKDEWANNYGYYRSYGLDYWHETMNYGEVGDAKNNILLRISRYGSSVTLQIKQGSTALYTRYFVSSTVETINCIRLWYKHHTQYKSGTSIWTINSIDTTNIEF
jgi:hypothetical protein